MLTYKELTDIWWTIFINMGSGHNSLSFARWMKRKYSSDESIKTHIDNIIKDKDELLKLCNCNDAKSTIIKQFIIDLNLVFN